MAMDGGTNSVCILFKILIICTSAVDCGSLHAPRNGSMTGSKTVFPNIIEFRCDEGFDLLGSASRKCKSDGKWSGNVTACKGTAKAIFLVQFINLIVKKDLYVF